MTGWFNKNEQTVVIGKIESFVFRDEKPVNQNAFGKKNNFCEKLVFYKDKSSKDQSTYGLRNKFF